MQMTESKTTLAGGMKIAVLLLSTLLTGAGATITGDGTILLQNGTGMMIIIGSLLYLSLSTAQGMLSAPASERALKPQLVVAIKAVMGGIVTVLLAHGINLQTGEITLSTGDEMWMLASAIAYYVLSATQAVLTSDWDGESFATSVVGVVKAVLGALGAVLLALGVDIESGQAALQPQALSIWAGLTYGLYAPLSMLQAYLTKDRSAEPATT